jgi:hypothetical protein
MVLALVSSFAGVAGAQDAPKIDISGYLDIYYLGPLYRPPFGAPINGRQFDVKGEQFTLAVAQLTFSKKAVPGSNVGGLIQLIAGNNADLMAALDPDGDSLKNIQQGYLSWAGNDGLSVDFGKFLTWIGAESVIAGDSDQYSRSFLFTYGQPIYHVGLRATKSFGALAGGFYLVNGWNEAGDSNAQKSLGISLGYAFSQGTVALNWYGGNEAAGSGEFPVGGIGFPDVGTRRVNLYDLVAVFNPIPKWKFAVNADYAKADSVNGSSSGAWEGVAFYAKYQATDKLASAARFEVFNDKDGLRFGVPLRVNSFTVNLDYLLDASTLLRVEFRHDSANEPYFICDSGFRKDRDTLTFAANLKF